MNILIIDDDDIILLTYQSLLEDFDFSIYTANTYNNAKTILLNNNINVIVLDLNMPDKYGIDIIKEFNSINPKLKFIINTGDNDFVIPNELKILGLDNNKNIITKPLFDINTLVDKIMD